MMDRFITFIERLKEKTFLQIFTIYLRYLIGGAFVIAAIAMGKLSGKSFIDTTTPLNQLHPIQQFFRVMAQSGLYWHFIGWFQIVCGALLITQRYAKTGAILFFGMIINIFIITVSYGFKGTPIVTGLMTLAALYLLIWDIHSTRFMIVKPTRANFKESPYLKIADHPFWSIVGIFILITTLVLPTIKVSFIITLAAPFMIGFISFILFFSLKNKLLPAQQNLQ